MTIHFLKGDDPTLVAQALKKIVDGLVGGGDRTLMVDELTESDYVGDGSAPADLAALVTSAATPPFLTERRVVIGRHLGLFTKGEQVAELVSWLADPTESTDLVLVWEKGASSQRLGSVPKVLKTALGAVQATELDAAPKGKGRSRLLEQRLGESVVRLDAGAKQLMASHLGDDVGRVEALLETLESSFGEGAALTANDVQPFLGQASDVPPWELTDAIDSGNISLALEKLGRMIAGGERHALQVLATLHGHYQRVLALDGANVRSESEAAALLNMKGSTFPARKAMTLGKKLGSAGVRTAVLTVANADLDVRGRSGADPNGVLEVLVARLARMSR